MDQALQEASIRGDTTLLHQILHQDPAILDRIQIGSLTHSPLHVAAFHGHHPFTTEIIKHCPGLVLVLDNRRWSPLHLAASQGYVDVARVLFKAGPEMCEVVDGDGYNPLHLAAIKGRTEVLTELLQAGKHAARRKTAVGEGILHLCVKYERLDCLKVLMENVKDLEFANGKDGDGNNVLHQAVKYKQIEIINYILAHNMVDINARNAMGLTPLDILILKQSYQNNDKDSEIKETLRHVGAMKSEEILSAIANDSEFHDTSSSNLNRVSNLESANHNHNYNNIFGGKDWLPRRRDSLMVVASLIATMAFTAGLNPPGGVWQENTIKLNDIPHRAGEAIIAYNYSDSYKFYLRSNTIAYVASLSIILLLISGLPFRRRRYMWTLQVVMWVTITAMAFTYAYALVALTPKKDRRSLRRTLVPAFLVWCIVMALVLIGNALRFSMKCLPMVKCMNFWKGRNQNDQLQI